MSEEHTTPLDEEVRRLPRQMMPERDLWPEIAAQLDPLELEGPQTSEGGSGSRQRWGAREWLLQGVAALFFMSLGSWMTQSPLAPGFDATPTESATWSARSARTAQTGPMSGVVPASYGSMGPIAGADAVQADLEDLELDYRQARDTLWLYLLNHRDSLPPGVLTVVEKNIEIIDHAGGQILDALRGDPGNPELERRLRENRKRSLGILRKLSQKV